MGAYAQLYGGIEERLTAAEDLRANGAGSHAMWRFIEESAGAMHSSVRRESAFLRLWWAVQGSVAVGSSVSLVAGALLVSNGSISLGTAFLMFQYVLLLERPLEDVVQQLETVQKANGAMVRVIDLLAERPTIIDAGTVPPPLARSASPTAMVLLTTGDAQPAPGTDSPSAPADRLASSVVPAAARPRSRGWSCAWWRPRMARCGWVASPSPTSRWSSSAVAWHSSRRRWSCSAAPSATT
jgi:ABC-type multidrug transport system fused ATPase/permease subunit